MHIRSKLISYFESTPKNTHNNQNCGPSVFKFPKPQKPCTNVVPGSIIVSLLLFGAAFSVTIYCPIM